MRKEQFISFIDAPAMQQGESVAMLSQLTQQFPYCQTAQLLLAKALHNDNSIGYSDQLKIAAAYASDRKVLYQLIMSKASAETASPGKEEAPAVTLAVPENDTELLNNLVVTEQTRAEEQETREPEKEEKEEPGIMEVSEPVTAVTEKASAETTEEHSGEKNEEEAAEIKIESTEPVEAPAAEEKQEEQKIKPDVTIEQTEPVQKPTPQEPGVNVEELPLLEKHIIVEAIDASIELEVAENMPFRETEDSTEEKSTEKNAEKPESTEEAGEEEEFDPNRSYSFSEWLKLSKKAKAKDSRSKNAGEEKDQAEKAEDESRTEKRKTIDDLIDKFISEEPKISRPTVKQEFFSPVNMARQSVQDDNDFVTETLANIYLKQGSYAKAIKAYETLSLKFPEKKLYFAARIKEIKKIIKEQK